MSRRGPLIIVLTIVAVGLIIMVTDAFNSHATVKAPDGTEVVIRLDAADIKDWSGGAGADALAGTRKYGVSVKPEAELPEGNTNEANLAGTKRAR